MSIFSPKTTINKITSPASDGIGRLKTAEPFTVFESKLLYDKQPSFYDEVLNGTATSTFQPNDAYVDLEVIANNDYAIRQTYMRFDYQAGKPQQVILTSVLNPEANTTKRIGLFNSDFVAPYDGGLDGICYETDGSQVYVAIYKSGTAIRRIPQASWNVDRLDGTGSSGITIDLTKVQIWGFEYLWLGVQGVSFFLKIDNEIVVIHQEDFTNTNGLASLTYMTSPNHSLRYEIRSTGGIGTLPHICAEVVSNAGTAPRGKDRDAFTDPSQTVTVNNNEIRPLIFMRLRDGYEGANIDFKSAYALATSGANFYKFVVYNPTVIDQGNGGAVVDLNSLAYNPVPFSSCEFFDVSSLGGNETDYVVTDLGKNIFTTIGSNNTDQSVAVIDGKERLGRSISGVRDIVCLAIRNVASGGSESFAGGINYTDIT